MNVDLLNENTKILIDEYNNRLTANNVPIIYNLRHLRKILLIKKNQQNKYWGKDRQLMYRRFFIPKKSGGNRTIEAPIDELKIRQQWIKRNILDKISVSEYAKGFKGDTSIYDNAVLHVNKELVMNLDIENFFPSITYNKVFRIFQYLGYNKQVSHLLTKMCTNQDNVLPQGAPTSPAISNIVLIKLDKRLGTLANKVGASYSRYADDITFSGKKNIKAVFPLIKKIVEEEGYKINEKKTRFQYSNQRQVVTGLTVNKRVSVSKNTIKELENAIYYCKKYGVSDHLDRINCDKWFYKEHLYGIAYFCKMIDEKKVYIIYLN